MGSLENFTYQDVALRLGAAAILSMILGFERELRGKPAGLRTHVLVALGAAGAMLVALDIFEGIHSRDGATGVDPIRAISGVFSGIGFLGAGALIRRHGAVQGLTTAANIWVTGAIGVACGSGHFVIAGIAVAIAFLTLTVLRFVERLIKRDFGD